MLVLFISLDLSPFTTGSNAMNYINLTIHCFFFLVIMFFSKSSFNLPNSPASSVVQDLQQTFTNILVNVLNPSIT